MDLTDWESPNPGLLHVPSDDAEWGSVFGRYAGTTNDGPLLRCIAVARENGAKSVVVETRYLGSDFRSEFAHFYSRTFAGVPDSAHRIHFFTEALDAARLLDLDDGAAREVEDEQAQQAGVELAHTADRQGKGMGVEDGRCEQAGGNADQVRAVHGGQRLTMGDT